MNQKLAVGILIMLTWGGLVVTGMTPVQPFVDCLKDILVGIGVYHAAITKGE